MSNWIQRLLGIACICFGLAGLASDHLDSFGWAHVEAAEPQSVFVVIVEKPGERTPAQAAVIDDPAWRKSLRERGHKFRLLPAGPQVDAQGYGPWLANVELPAEIIQDFNGHKLKVAHLPDTAAGADELVKEAAGE